MDESMTHQPANRPYDHSDVDDMYAEREARRKTLEVSVLRHALKEIREIAEDHVDYDTADWHLVLKLAYSALGEGQ